MKMKFFLTLLFLPLTLMAQTTKQLTLDDLMWGGSAYWSHQPKTLSAKWWGDVLVEPKVDEVGLLTNAKGEKVEGTLFTLEEVNAALGGTEKVHTLQYVDFIGSEKQALLSTNTTTFVYDWENKSIVWRQPRERGVQARDFNKASKNVAYVKDYNLYVCTADGKTLQVSKDGSREIPYGTSVHRDEFGISKGTFWSPKGNLLAFYRMDQTMVTDFPLIDINHRVAELAPEKYPMAGMTSHKVTVGVFNPATGESHYLKAGDPTDRYFTNISWSPDEKTIYVIELPRTQDKAEIVAYDAATGERKGVIYTETNTRYVEPMNPIVFLPWDDTKFIFQSRRDGWNHIYLFNADGTEVAQLTKGTFEVIDVLGFNTKERSVIYKSNAQSPVCRNYHSVSVKNGKSTLLDNGVGCHNASLSASGKFLCDQWTSPDVFCRIELLGGKKTLQLQNLNAPYADYKMPEIKSGSIKAADDSTDLYYRLVLPVNFDTTKKYPTVVYVYGGPHAHNVNSSWNYAARPWEIYMAQKDYVIFVVDNRGSQYRGFEFESVTHRRLGVIEMADQMRGVDFLKTLPYVDANRIGVHGWSFGGFMTTNLMVTHPETFKVGVAGGPVIDWKFYEVMYGERYMDTPQENPEGYASSNVNSRAANLKGRLQIIVGLNDPVCVLQHSLSFLRACEDAGTQPDYFVYPGQGHNMMGKDMVHLHDRITRYFDDYLK